MAIISWISGILGLLLVAVFLGKYAVSIDSIPLWVIILGVLVFPAYDLVKTLRGGNAGANEARRDGSKTGS